MTRIFLPGHGVFRFSAVFEIEKDVQWHYSYGIRCARSVVSIGMFKFSSSQFKIF